METPETSNMEDAIIATNSQICGFWRRVIAFAIDYIVLNVVVCLIITILHPHYDTLVSYKAILSIIISFGYFSICCSYLNVGQTIGMLIMKVRVTRLSGEPLSFSQSSARASILCVPLLSNILLGYPRLCASSLVIIIVSITAIVSTIIAYLLIFNRRNGRSLHDLIANTVVVRSQPSGPAIDMGIARIHFVFIPIICLLVLASGILFYNLVKPVNGLYASIADVAGAFPIAVNVNRSVGPSESSEIAQIVVSTDGKFDPIKLSQTVAKMVATQLPEVEFISVIIREDQTDLYLVEFNHTISFAASASAWLHDEPIDMVDHMNSRILFFNLFYRKDGSIH